MTGKHWQYAAEHEPSPALSGAIGGHALVAQGLINRGISTVGAALPFLEPDRYQASSASELGGIEAATSRIQRAIDHREQICVWGDFDLDGQTATAVLFSTLQELEAHVTFYVPHRATESHGLSSEGVKRIASQGATLIITCDTGIRDHEAIQIADELGVDVIITDHHDPPAELPRAIACLNPKLLPGEHPLRDLPGVGAAFVLAWALLDATGQPQLPRRYLDLVALGIVADLAQLRKDTRYYLQLGLEVLRRTSRPGLQALMQLAGLTPEGINEGDIGFTIAPRLNSLGRLGDANRAVEFLTTEDADFAMAMAEELEGLNARRRLLTDQVYQAAESRLDHASDAPAIILEHREWPDGVIGLVAGRLADEYGRPAVLITVGDDGLGRASARSVPGIDITSALEANGSLLERFGGHPMAGGFAIKSESIAEFKAALNRTLLDARPIAPSLRIDGEVELRELTVDFVRDLERLAPFGPGNPSFVLVANAVTVRGVRSFGRNSDHLRLKVADRHSSVAEVIWWRGARETMPDGRFDLAFGPRSHYYKGELGIQLEWIDARQEPEPTQIALTATVPNLVDLREVSNPLAAVREIGSAQIWSEAIEADEIEVHNRWDLIPDSRLAIWSTPPGPGELRAAVRKVRPATIYIFRRSQNELLAEWLERLIGLAKFAIRQRDGAFDVRLAAAALGHREMTIEAGLNWLEQEGVISIERTEGHRWKLDAGAESTTRLGAPPEALQGLLRETAAFRSYWGEADIDSLRRLLA